MSRPAGLQIANNASLASAEQNEWLRFVVCHCKSTEVTRESTHSSSAAHLTFQPPIEAMKLSLALAALCAASASAFAPAAVAPRAVTASGSALK